MLCLFSNLNEDIYYRYQELAPDYIRYSESLLVYYKFLELIGLLKYKYYPYITISITPFGKKKYLT